MNYRPDIDGLRAIAILFVLFFHAGLKFFPSGFIGVDIFFVISGFLISSIINDSLQKKSFSFIEFYSRRLWRLQPLFICLLICTTILTFLFFLPEDLLHYFNSAKKSSLFLANNFFGRISTDYFSAANNQLPLLHTWSLSVEWQCYLLLPIALYGLHRLFGERYLSRIIFVLTLLFFALALYSSLNYPAKSYYQLCNRIFEFLIGCCLAFGHKELKCNKYLLELISLLALSVLFYLATRSNISLGFPNGYALILCLATTVILASGQQNPKPMVTEILATKPLVFLGLISYSLYLWHWPVFVVIRYLDIKESPAILLLAFALVFIVAYLSWRFIEKPFRQFKTLKFGYTLTYLLVVPISLITLGDYIVKNQAGYPQRFRETARIYAKLKQYNYPQRDLCLKDKITPIDNRCILGSTNKKNKTGFMIGDSFSNHFWGFMDKVAKESHVSILAHATSACLALPGISLIDWNFEKYSACRGQTIKYFKMIKENHYDYVIIGQNWNGYLYGKLTLPLKKDGSFKPAAECIEKALDKALGLIVAAGSQPVLIKSIAISTTNPHDCFFGHIKRRTQYDPKQCDFKRKPQEQQWQNDLFARMKSKYKQLVLIDPQKVQCPKGLCKADINGVPIFQDGGHITDYASYHWAKHYLKHNKNPLMLQGQEAG